MNEINNKLSSLLNIISCIVLCVLCCLACKPGTEKNGDLISNSIESDSLRTNLGNIEPSINDLKGRLIKESQNPIYFRYTEIEGLEKDYKILGQFSILDKRDFTNYGLIRLKKDTINVFILEYGIEKHNPKAGFHLVDSIYFTQKDTEIFAYDCDSTSNDNGNLFALVVEDLDNFSDYTYAINRLWEIDIKEGRIKEIADSRGFRCVNPVVED